MIPSTARVGLAFVRRLSAVGVIESLRFHLLSLILISTAAAAAADDAPRMQFAFEARVTVDKPLVVGPSAHGLRRIVPITGGSFAGPLIKGKIVPGGADW